MTNQEQDIKIERTRQEVDDFKMVIESFIAEMRDRDNQRAEENRELRKKQDEAQTKHDADIKAIQERQDSISNELRADMKELRNEIRGFIIAIIVGIAAIVISVIAFVWTSASNQPPVYYQPPPQNQAAYIQPSR